MIHTITPPRASASQAPAPTRSPLDRFLDWLYGSPDEATHDTPATLDTKPTRLEPYPMAGAATEPAVTVDPPSQSAWGDSFKTALTEAASLFIQRHVEPFHQEDPCIAFAVRRVKVGYNEAAAIILRDIQTMRQDMRDGIAKIRIKKAKGADQQLFLEEFYGISFCADDTMVDGQLVETLVYSGGSRLSLKFEFEGDYLSLPERAPAAQPLHATEPGARPVPVPAADDTDDTDDTDDRSTPVRKSAEPEHPAWQDERHTPVNTGIRPSTRMAAARLHLRVGGQQASVDLFEDNFPYTVGHHPTQAGFCITGSRDTPAQALLPSAESAGEPSYVSRQHLVLQRLDSLGGEISVDNLAAQPGKNGTYRNASAMGPRFLYSLAQAPWLTLGGPPHGRGILEIKVSKT